MASALGCFDVPAAGCAVRFVSGYCYVALSCAKGFGTGVDAWEAHYFASFLVASFYSDSCGVVRHRVRLNIYMKKG